MKPITSISNTSFKPIQTNINFSSTGVTSTTSTGASPVNTVFVRNLTASSKNSLVNTNSQFSAFKNTKLKQICTPYNQINLNLNEKKNSFVVLNKCDDVGKLVNSNAEQQGVLKLQGMKANDNGLQEEFEIDGAEKKSEVNDNQQNANGSNESIDGDLKLPDKSLSLGSNDQIKPDPLFQNFSVITTSTDLIKDLSNTNFNLFSMGTKTSTDSAAPESRQKENIFLKSEALNKSPPEPNVIDTTTTSADDTNNKPKHECSNSSHQAMIECQLCGLFCHSDCVSSFNSIKLCSFCFKKKDKKQLNGEKTGGDNEFADEKSHVDSCGEPGYELTRDNEVNMVKFPNSKLTKTKRKPSKKA